MRILNFFFIIFFTFFLNFSYASYDQEKNKITKNLRCLICQGQSVYDSDSEFANSMKILV
jgi:cytochrome c-type biogenesis protein CcmH